MMQSSLKRLAMMPSLRVFFRETSTSGLASTHSRRSITVATKQKQKKQSASMTFMRTMSSISSSDDVVHVTRPSPHVALISLQNHPVNALSSRMVTQLENALAFIHASSGADAAVRGLSD